MAVITPHLFRINGVDWSPEFKKRDPKKTALRYKYDYPALFQHILNDDPKNELSYYRELIKRDLWFVCRFVLKVPIFDHQFFIDRCVELEEGPTTETLDLWAREHGKSTIITIAETIQDVCRNREETIGIFSYNKTAAQGFLRSIKTTFEESKLLHACFPEIFYENPKKESTKWSEIDGIQVKRESVQKEPTVSPHGLLEGMPTGGHYSVLKFDDVETLDTTTPATTAKLKEAYTMALNLGSMYGRRRVIGTTYSYDGLLQTLREQVNTKGEPVYHTRVLTATVDGSVYGPSVLLPESRLELLRLNMRTFASQQLLNPVPEGEASLNVDGIEIRSELPDRLYKFLLIDPAGGHNMRTANRDRWAIATVGIVPYRNDLGLSELWVLDLCIEKMNHDDAIKKIVQMYLQAGKVIKVAVEKVGLSTTEVHVANALKGHGKYISVEAGNLQILRPEGRNKRDRIMSALAWPLANSKVKIWDRVGAEPINELMSEIKRFPFGKDDGIDILSYAYDVTRDYRFPLADVGEKVDRVLDKYEIARIRMQAAMNGSNRGWMVR